MNKASKVSRSTAGRCLFAGCTSKKQGRQKNQCLSGSFRQQTVRYSQSHHSQRRKMHTTPVIYLKQQHTANLKNLKQESSADGLKERMQSLIHSPVGSWTRKDIASGRSLFWHWLKLAASSPDRAPWAQRILVRWIQERTAENQKIEFASSEMLDMLHHVLNAWRMTAFEGVNAFDECVTLLDRMERLYRATKDERLRLDDEAYVLALETLAFSPHDPTLDACEEASNLLWQCSDSKEGGNNCPDIAVLNSSLRVFAKHSPYHADAPAQAEQLLEHMMRGSLQNRNSDTARQANAPYPNVASFESVLQAWASSHRPEAPKRAQAILENMLQQTHHRVPLPNATCFNVCIAAHGKGTDTRSAQRAQDLLELMLSGTLPIQVRPDDKSFLFALNAWAKCGNDPNAAENAEALLARMQLLYQETGDSIIRPTAACYAAVLNAWAQRQNSGPKVESLLEQMEESLENASMTMEKACYLAAIRAWGNTTSMIEAPERAEAILHRMEEHASSMKTTVHELMPCVRTYSAVIGAWAKSTREDAPRRALALLRSMQKKAVIEQSHHVSPNTIVFNNVLNSLASKGDAESAMELLTEMKMLRENGDYKAQPDGVSYATVIKALALSNKYDGPETATDLLDELINSYIRGGKQNNMRPTTHAFSSAMIAWSNHKRQDCGEKAEGLLWKMIELSNEEDKSEGAALRPDVIVCNVVLRAWACSTDGVAPNRAEAILEWMDNQVKNGTNKSVKPNWTTFTYILRSWANSRRASSVRRIEEHLQRMIRESQNKPSHQMFPNASCYNSLLEAIQNSRQAEKARKCQIILEQLLQKSSTNDSMKLWNLHSFNIVFMACLQTSVADEESRQIVRGVLQTTFQHLRSNNATVTKQTMGLYLRAYSKVESRNDSFILDVFQFCDENQIDTREVLGTLRGSISEWIHQTFDKYDTQAGYGR